MSKIRRRTFNTGIAALAPAILTGCSGDEETAAGTPPGDSDGAAGLGSTGTGATATGSAGTGVTGTPSAGSGSPSAGAPGAGTGAPQDTGTQNTGTQDTGTAAPANSDAVTPSTNPEATTTSSASAEPGDTTQPADTSVEQTDPPAMATIPKVALGNTGLMVPMLAMGTGTAGWEGTSSQTELGQDEFVNLMRHGFDRGATFLDLADLYGSHGHSRLVLEQVPRDSVTVATKIWWREDGGLAPAREGRSEVMRFLDELGTDYLDIVLIHSLLQDTWVTDLAQMRDELAELKAEGLIRAVGCSCHTFATLKQAAEDPWVDVIFARVNPAGIRMDPDGTIEDVNETLKLARANGKGVVGMKIYGDGAYAEETQRIESMRSAFQNGFVDAVTIGHMSKEQFDDTVVKLTAALA